MNEIEKKNRELTITIAERIRELRKDRGWTLLQLARVTGFSKGYLSQVENAEKNPPINTLNKIAYGLGVDVAALITGEGAEKPKPFTLVRRGERKNVTPMDSHKGYIYESLAYKKADRLMDVFIVEVSPHAADDFYAHEGQEIALVLEGRQEFTYGKETMLMEPGDTAYFDSNQPHKARALDGRSCKVLVVFTNPRRSG